MSNTVGTLEQLAGELALVFEPLARQIEADSIHELLPSLGFRSFEIETGSTDLLATLITGATAASDLEPLINNLAHAVDQDDRPAIAATTAQLLQQLHTLLQSFDSTSEALRTLANDPSLTAQQRSEITVFASGFIERLLHRLFADYLEARFPYLAIPLIAIGAIEIVEEAGLPPSSLHGPYVRKTVHVERLLKFGSMQIGVGK